MELRDSVLKHPRNKKIEFIKEGHTYIFKKTVRSKSEKFTGVTSWIGEYTAPFEKEKIARNYSKRHGMSYKEVLDLWNYDREYGNYVHDTIENYLNNGVIEDTVELKNFCRLCEELKLIPITGEWIIYDETIKKASAVDIVCERDGKLVVVDLKTMKNPIKIAPYGKKDKKMVHPLNDLPDSTFYKHNLQTNIYKYWIKKHYGLPVDDVSYVFHLNGELNEVLTCFDLEYYVEKMYHSDSSS